MTISDVL